MQIKSTHLNEIHEILKDREVQTFDVSLRNCEPTTFYSMVLGGPVTVLTIDEPIRPKDYISFIEKLRAAILGDKSENLYIFATPNGAGEFLEFLLSIEYEAEIEVFEVGEEEDDIQDRKFESAPSKDEPEPMPATENRDAHEILDELSGQLVDMSRRNRLLNYTSGKDSIRIIDESPNGLYTILVEQRKLMKLDPLWNAPVEEQYEAIIGSGSENPEPKARKLDLDLVDSGEAAPRHLDEQIQTAHSPKVLQTISLKAYTAAQHIIKTTGTNQLYLAIGFLKWYEKEDSDTPSRSPLLLIPLTIEREKKLLDEPILPSDPDYDEDAPSRTRRVQRFAYFVKYTEEEIVPNKALRIRMESDFDLAFPDNFQNFSEDSYTPEDYLKEVIDWAVSYRQDPRWKVDRHAAIGFFDFSKVWMHEDLSDKVWKEQNCKALNIIFGGVENRQPKEFSNSEIETSESSFNIPLVCPADTSQYKVIMRSRGEESLVIEGPPGTGKSQTIANIIASLIDKGEKILFLAAKETALSVVQKRLENVGLGDFLLPMHADGKTAGTNSIEIANSIERRQRPLSRFESVTPAKLNELDSKATHLRNILNEAAEKLSKVDPETQKKLSELLWETNLAWDRYEQECKSLNLEPELLPVDEALGKYGFHGALQESKDFLLHINDLEEEGALKPNTEWQGVILDDVDKDITDSIIESAQELSDRWTEFEKHNCPIRVSKEIATPQNLLNWRLCAQQARLPQWKLGRIGSEDTILEAPLEAVRTMEDLLEVIERHNSLADTLDIPPARLPSGEQIKKLIESRDELVGKHSTWRNAGNQISLNDIRLRLEKIRSIVQAIWSNESVISCTPVDDVNQISVSNMREWLTLIREISSPEGVQWGFLTPELAQADLSKIMPVMTAQIKKARENRKEIETKLDLSCYPDEDAIKDIKKRLRNSSLWSRLFGEHKKALQEARGFFNIPVKDAEDVLNTIGSYNLLLDLESKIENNEDAKQYFGEFYNGQDTDWAHIETAIKQVRTIVDIAGIRRLPEILAQDSPHASADLLEDSVEAFEGLKVLIDAHVELTDYKLTHLSAMHWGDLVGSLDEAIEDIAAIISWYDTVTWEPWRQIPFGQVGSILETALEFANLIQKIPAHDSKNHLGSLFKGVNTSAETISETITAARAINALTKDSLETETLVEYLKNEPWNNAFQSLNQWSSKTAESVDALASVEKVLKETGTLNPGDPFAPSEFDMPLAQWHDVIRRRVSNPQGLHQWHELTQKLESGKQFGLTSVLEWILSGQAPVSIIEGAFRASVFNLHVQNFCEKNEIDIEKLRDSRLNRRRLEFVKSDRERLEAFPKEIAARHARPTIPDEGRSGSRISEKRGMNLIKHARGKKRSSITVRDLMQRSFETIQTLKPCWLMSPGSVSQYLERTNDLFDVLIIDEASQLRTSEIAGAALRSKRMLIFGDTQQMPPAGFGKRFAKTDDEDYELGESVLERAAMSMPSVRLEWHYRSQHEDLIRYSNQHFYDNSLVIFPSRKKQDKELGIRHQFVNGYFVGKRNKAEADAATETLRQHVLGEAHKPLEERCTVGVVTMNGEQRDLIIELVDRMRSEDELFGRALQDSLASEEPYFITNLENVQGDERDHIVICFTYGPEAAGLKTKNNFGPINNAGGDRRLNVLYTRSRMKMTVLSSMHPHDITSNSAGARHMRGFLEYAQTGILTDQGDDSTGEAENVFEETVGKALMDAGYKISFQVGVKGYRIDIAIHDPDAEGHYVMAIECDGATYHSSVTARERDRLRQEILEHAGWRFFRVWSTDWFHEKERTIRRMLAAVQERVDDIRAQERKLADEAEKQLAEYESVSSEIADSPPAQNILPSVKPDSELKQEPAPAEEVFKQFDSVLQHQRVSTQSAKQVDDPIESVLADDSDEKYPHPVYSPKSIIIAFLKKLVGQQGPLKAHHALRIFCRRSGSKKLGKNIEENLTEALETALSTGEIQATACSAEKPLLERIIKTRDQPDYLIRPEFQRDLDDIPNIELVAVIRNFERQEAFSEEEELFRAVLAFYGKKRLTEKVSKHLKSLLAEDAPELFNS